MSNFYLPLAVSLLVSAFFNPARGAEALIWQGLDHQWQRQVLGFQTPHRIEVQSSLISEQQTGQALQVQALVGQSPGVDGDFMTAKMYAEQVSAPGLQFQSTQVELELEDLMEGPGPRPVLSQNSGRAQFDFAQAIDPSTTHFSAVLNGYSINSECLPVAGKKCNSNGFWPYQMELELGTCQLGPERRQLNCQVSAKIGRSWTPNHGGVPGLDNKPINFSMKFKVQIAVLLALGPANDFSFENKNLGPKFYSNNRKQSPGARLVEVPEAIKSAAAYSFGFNKLSFSLQGRGQRSPGRYLTGLVAMGQKVKLAGEEKIALQGRVVIPRTVNKTPVELELGLTFWAFHHPDSKVQALPVLTSQVCVESRQAPFYSAWHGCQKLGYPLNRQQELIKLELPALDSVN